MMKLTSLLFGTAILLSTQIASVQAEDGLTAFKPDEDSWRRAEEPETPKVLPYLKDSIAPLALQTIMEAEQAFCYNVAPASPDYTGYTLDGMALTGFCGMLPKIERDIFITEFLTNEQNVSTVNDSCRIQPRVMLRYVRGVDFVDILYSYPCPSFTIFYAGKIKSFNTAPADQIVEVLVGAYEKQKSEFLSPALTNQLLPIAVPQTDEQKALLREKAAAKPIRNWKTPDTPTTDRQSPTPSSTTTAEPAKKGWNNLKFGRSK